MFAVLTHEEAARYTKAARQKILAASGMHLLVSQTGNESVRPSELRPLKKVSNPLVSS